MVANLLLVEDEPETQDLIVEALGKLGNGFAVKAVRTARAALDYLAGHELECVLLDYNLPDGSGLHLLKRIRELRPAVPVIFVTVLGEPRRIVEALQLGAAHYVVKHGSYLGELLQSVREVVGQRELARALAPPSSDAGHARHDGQSACRLDGVIGSSPAIQEAIAAAAKAARSRIPVLLQGETGTGKELFARAIHYNGSRHRGPFVTVNCPAIPRDLLESELFGHVRGAFTGAVDNRRGLFDSADGGTIFLDEVGELELSVQAKLLRALDDQQIQPVGSDTAHRVLVRVVAATNRDLACACEQGVFRQDLYYRLKGLRIVLPPLRERHSDIAPLFRHFVAHFGQEESRLPGRIDAETIRMLQRYAWPGNVRELRHEAQRVVACIEAGERITPDLLSPEIRESSAIDDGGTLEEVMSRVETALLRARLREHGYNIAAAARSLGITREWLSKRMRQLGIAHPDR